MKYNFMSRIENIVDGRADNEMTRGTYRGFVLEKDPIYKEMFTPKDPTTGEYLPLGRFKSISLCYAAIDKHLSTKSPIETIPSEQYEQLRRSTTENVQG